MVSPWNRLWPPSSSSNSDVLQADQGAQEEQDVEQALHAEDPALAEA